MSEERFHSEASLKMQSHVLATKGRKVLVFMLIHQTSSIIKKILSISVVNPMSSDSLSVKSNRLVSSSKYSSQSDTWALPRPTESQSRRVGPAVMFQQAFHGILKQEFENHRSRSSLRFSLVPKFSNSNVQLQSVLCKTVCLCGDRLIALSWKDMCGYFLPSFCRSGLLRPKPLRYLSKTNTGSSHVCSAVGHSCVRAN